MLANGSFPHDHDHHPHNHHDHHPHNHHDHHPHNHHDHHPHNHHPNNHHDHDHHPHNHHDPKTITDLTLPRSTSHSASHHESLSSG